MTMRKFAKSLARLQVSGTAIAVVLGSGAAYAQDAPTPDTATAQTDVSSADNAAGERTDQEIIVSATRRDETLSKVPVSVAAFSQERLDQQGVRSIDDISRLAPGITFNRTDTRNAGAANISIRGISSGAGAATTGIYIDDTPIQSRNFGYSSYSVFPYIFDLERVEVLRGPQGTLFGAGAEGGVVRFITPAPDLENFHAYGRAELAGTDGGGTSYEAGLAVGGPIVRDKLAFRVSAWHRRDGGYVDRLQYDRPAGGPPYLSTCFITPSSCPVTAGILAALGNVPGVGPLLVAANSNYFASQFPGVTPGGYAQPTTGKLIEKNSNYTDIDVLRGALTLAPTEDLTLTAAIYYQNIYNHDTNAYWVNLSDPADGRFAQGNAKAQPSHDRFYLPTFKADWELGPVRLVSDTSYFDRKQRAVNDYTAFEHSLYYGSYLSAVGDYHPSFQFNSQKNFSEEFRVESADPAARLTWVVGMFYTHNRQVAKQFVATLTTPVSFPAGGCPPFTVAPFCYGPLQAGGPGAPMQGAVFGDALDPGIVRETQLAGFAQGDFKLTPELTVTAGARVARSKVDIYFNNYGPIVGPTPVVAEAKQKETPVTPKFGVSYQPSPDTLLYVSAAKGFRTGGGNPEIGAGCRLPLAANGFSAYKSDSLWSYEVGAKSKLLGRRLQFATSAYYVDWKNIQQSIALTCGFQFVINAGSAVSKGFDVDATLNVTDRFQLTAAAGYNFAKFKDNVPNPASPGTNLVSAGDRIQGAPWTVALSGRYEFPLLSHDGYFRADYQYLSAGPKQVSSQNPANGGSFNPLIPRLPSSETLNLRLGATTDVLDVSLFVNNVFNVHPQTSLNPSIAVFAGNNPLLFQATTLRPRTFGLTVSGRY
jgi:outer membrane receptor protein involved in Fe transport